MFSFCWSQALVFFCLFCGKPGGGALISLVTMFDPASADAEDCSDGVSPRPCRISYEGYVFSCVGSVFKSSFISFLLPAYSFLD